jgi:hypothetical protein
MSKRKAALAKVYKPNYTKEVYIIFKIRKPQAINTNKPYQYFVKNKQTGETKKIQDRPVPYTIKDFMVIDPDVQTAPDDIKIDQTPQKAETRSGTKAQAQPEQPAPRRKSARAQAKQAPPPPPPKPKKPQEDPKVYVGKRVKSMDSKGKLTGKGTITSVNTDKSYPRFDVEWDKEYGYDDGVYTKTDIKKMLV